MNHWLFQGNPSYWRVFDYLAEHGRGALENWSWSARRFLEEITPGDVAVLWMSGSRKTRGVYGAGRVTGEPFLSASDDTAYWNDPAEAAVKRFSVPMCLDVDVFDTPILAVELIGDRRFHDASIIRLPRAANPHRLTKQQWRAIEERLP